MNTKQLNTWREIVEQCQSQAYSRINVASKVRGDAIAAVDKLAQLVTVELAGTLEALAIAGDLTAHPTVANHARTLAAQIREALVDDS